MKTIRDHLLAIVRRVDEIGDKWERDEWTDADALDAMYDLSYEARRLLSDLASRPPRRGVSKPARVSGCKYCGASDHSPDMPQIVCVHVLCEERDDAYHKSLDEQCAREAMEEDYARALKDRDADRAAIRRLKEAVEGLLDIHDGECRSGLRCEQVQEYRDALTTHADAIRRATEGT